jgi:hypothetical protein
MSDLTANKHVRYVDSFEALIAARFEGDVNALCWPRHVSGDFQEILDKLNADDGMTTIEDDDLTALELTAAGARARDFLLADQALLRAHGLAPSLDVITSYPCDDSNGVIATDVYSFHADRAPIAADTYLCTYVGAPSEAVANAFAMRRVDDPETRARALLAYGGADDDGFAAYLAEHSYDLHYAERPGATPYGFGLYNLWRIAIMHPESPVLPCIHRAPAMPPGAPSRLLLIS